MEIKNTSKRTWIFLFIGILALSIILFIMYSIFSRELYHDPIFKTQGSAYDAKKEINSALIKLETQRKKASIIKAINTTEKKVSITFDDLSDDITMNNLVNLLDEYDAKATFFVPAIEAAENTSILNVILDRHQEIGNYTLSGLRQMELMDTKDLVADFSRSGLVLKDITGKSISLLKCNGTIYTDELLEIAFASGIDSVVESTYFLNYKSFSSYEMTLDYIKGIKRGSILSIKIDDYLDPSELNTTRKEETPSIEEKTIIDSTVENSVNPQERLLLVTEWILKALVEAEYTTEFVKDLPYYHQDPNNNVDNEAPYISKKYPPYFNYIVDDKRDFPAFVKYKGMNFTPSNYEKLRLENNGRLTELVYGLYTTQPAVSYIFRGVSDKATVDNILEILDSIEAKATFFVTGKEIVSYPDTIAAIVAKGHSLGNGGYGMNIKNPGALSFNEIAYEVEMGEKILKAYMGENYEDSNKYYMPLYADTNGFVQEAASALGYSKTIIYNRRPNLSSYSDLTSKEILDRYFENIVALHRGDIVYFRLDYLTQLGAIEDLVLETAQRFIKVSNYDIVPVDQLITHPLVYVPKTREFGIGSDSIKPSYNYDNFTLKNSVLNNYIGNPDTNTVENLIGFSSEEIQHIDTSGKINTNGEKIIFLTFDDWGSDIAISRLLSVLNKHDVKASFFIRVANDKIPYENDMINPNLLRAIALEGHDIANHTFTHMKINITTEEEQYQLQNDIVTAHKEMTRYIGDTGALKSMFRPPTLAVSKLGLHTIFNTGYSYVVSGDYSTQDYNAPSLEILVDQLKNGINLDDRVSVVTPDTPPSRIRRIEAGSVVVMHMSDESKYTPDALDIVIPYYINQGYRFEKLSNYLKEDYKNIP